MSQTAHRLLCIPASSAQSEIECSSIERTVTDMRSRLNENTGGGVECCGMRAGLITNQ